MKDPARLLDDPLGAPEELRRGLDRLSATRPGPEQVAALAARMGLASLPPPSPAPAAGAKSTAVLKLIAAIGVGGAVAGGYVLTRSNGPPAREAAATAPAARPAAGSDSALRGDAPTPARARHAQSPAPSPAMESDRAQPEPKSMAQSPERAARPELELEAPPAAGARSGSNGQTPRTHRAGARPAADVERETASAGPSSMQALSETELLGDARSALDKSPAVALTFCERHRREFPNGALVQEREIIAVTALVRLGRTGDAKARAERFRRSYPRSAYLRQLERVISVAE